jgi:hypothetical protein
MAKVYLATIEYFATGEGIQNYAFAHSAKDKLDFYRMVVDKYGGWLAENATIYEKYPEDGVDSILGRFISEPVKKMLTKYLDEGIDCHFSYFSDYYLNCS